MFWIFLFNSFRGKKKRFFFFFFKSDSWSADVACFNSTWNATSRWDKPTAAEQKSASCDMWCSKPKNNRLEINKNRQSVRWKVKYSLQMLQNNKYWIFSVYKTIFLSKNDDYHHGYESADITLLHDHPSQQEKWAFIQRSKVGLINTCSKRNTITTNNIAAATIQIRVGKLQLYLCILTLGGSCTSEYFWII